jgi:hypothetical protein
MPFVSTADLSVPVSFMADVAPIFAQHCATGGGRCHGDVVTLPYLGLPEGSADPATVLANIVGVASGENPAMPYVAPGDPGQSYLIFKIDGDQCTLAQACGKGPFGAEFPTCGATMPFLSAQLPVETRDAVRRWVAQGAQNN